MPKSPDYLTQPPLQVATKLVQSDFVACLAAFLAGSVVREEHTASSDLDIVIITLHDPAAPYRKSCVQGGWPIELFVHTPESLTRFFEMDKASRTPSLPQMVSEGIVISQQEFWAEKFKTQAESVLQAGPEALSESEIQSTRYQLSDLLEDLRGSQRPEESLFIAAELAEKAAQFYLSYHQYWNGHGKWLHRALKRANPELANSLVQALDALYQDRISHLLIQWVQAVLEPVGGTLFDGYYLRANQPK